MAQIEAEMRRQHPVSHHRMVVEVPWETDAEAYLRELPCPCGEESCELQTFGLVIPQRLDAESWSHQAQAYAAQRGEHDAL